MNRATKNAIAKNKEAAVRKEAAEYALREAVYEAVQAGYPLSECIKIAREVVRG